MLQFLLNDERESLDLDGIDKTSLRTVLLSWGTRLVGHNLVIGKQFGNRTTTSLARWQSRPIAISSGCYSVDILFEDGSEWDGIIRDKITLSDAINKYLI